MPKPGMQRCRLDQPAFGRSGRGAYAVLTEEGGTSNARLSWSQADRRGLHLERPPQLEQS